MPVLALLLVLASGLTAFAGFVQLTQATVGVGTIALACYLGIVARLVQASGHLDAEKDLFAGLRRTIRGDTPQTPKPTAAPLIHEPPPPATKYLGLTSVQWIFVVLGIAFTASFVSQWIGVIRE